MDGQAILELLKTNLQAAMPQQLVTRDAQDFAQRDKGTCKAGVITLVSEQMSGLNAAANLQDISGKLQIYLLYEFSRAEGTPGSEIEAEEWRFLQALIDFVGTPGANLCPLEFGSIPVQFSAQDRKRTRLNSSH